MLGLIVLLMHKGRIAGLHLAPYEIQFSATFFLWMLVPVHTTRVPPPETVVQASGLGLEEVLTCEGCTGPAFL